MTTIQPEQMIAALLVIAAIFSYFNERFLGISATIGMLLISLLVSVVIFSLLVQGLTIGRLFSQDQLREIAKLLV